jgi:hypothetical protein
MNDISSQIKLQRAISPVVVTDNTAQVSTALDCAGFTGAVVAIATGTLSDADATTVVLLEESDASGSGYTAVADADLIGTELAAAPGFADDNECFKLGYKGTKRYLRLTVTPSGNTGNIPLSAVWILTSPRSVPQATQNT